MKARLLFICLVFFSQSGFAQVKNLSSSIELQGIATSDSTVPFWFRSNQFGSKPLSGISSSLLLSSRKSYDTARRGFFDWGFGVETRANVGKTSKLQLIEGYGKLKVFMFEVKGGRSKDVMGLADSTLTSGSYSVAGNTLGIPKIELSVPDYFSIPFANELIAVKGSYAHGWFGNTAIGFRYRMPGVDNAKTYLHQKSLYGRLGKPNWKIKLFGGVNHQAQWGHETTFLYPSQYNYDEWSTYKMIVKGGNRGSFSRVGNHLGSIDFGAEYSLEKIKLLIYRQNIYETGALGHFANLRDGLNGISITNIAQKKGHSGWEKVVLEFLYTKNQAGELWSKYTPSGDEDYYNNYLYKNGWSYKGDGIGTPFITTKNDMRKSLPQSSRDYFVNNRIALFHFGIQGSLKAIQYKSKISYSQNWGTYGSSLIGNSTGYYRSPTNLDFKKVNQFSAYLEASKQLKNNYFVGARAAVDEGKLLYNSSGFILSVSKRF